MSDSISNVSSIFTLILSMKPAKVWELEIFLANSLCINELSPINSLKVVVAALFRGVGEGASFIFFCFNIKKFRYTVFRCTLSRNLALYGQILLQ